MRTRPIRRALAAALVLVLAATGIAVAAGSSSTVNQTIADRDGDDRLEPAPGDAYLQRSDLGTRTSAREGAPLVTFGQLTDMHVVDEESPARVEFLDKVGDPFTSAYRPHEGIGPQVADAMVRQMANANSPATHRRIDAVMTTGDNTDNTQCNETRWMIDILDGEADADPGTAATPNCVTVPALRPTSRKVDPNSGLEGSCATTPDGSVYDGVRGDREYYEPDASDGQDGQGYSPRPAENGRPSTVRDFPGLFERMNEPFLPTGFKAVPWYGIFGNHDGLVQGNQSRNAALDAVAVGCTKVTGLPVGTDTSPAGLRDALIAVAGGKDPALTRNVPMDPRRHLLSKREYIAQHFVTSGSPAGHGFGPENLASGEGYYAFTPRPGVRFVVLDSVGEPGGDSGNIGERQFTWLDDQLEQAEAQGQLTLVFAHHTLETLTPPSGPFPSGDNPLPVEYDAPFHYGETSEQSRCPETGPGATETVKCLFLRHPTVIGFITGHEHRNRIRAVPRGSGPEAGGFWQVTTASHIDWPQQSRLLDVVDNGDGSVSLWGTILDHDAPANPGSGVGSSAKQLASISRELSFNDPDARNGEDGSGDARGGEGDRNVELVVHDPR